MVTGLYAPESGYFYILVSDKNMDYSFIVNFKKFSIAFLGSIRFPNGMNDSLQPAIDFSETDTRITIPVSVVLERTMRPTGQWAYPSWKVFALVTGEHLRRHDQNFVVHDDGSSKRFYWGGMNLRLFKDGGEGYWYNLLSDVPYLFVVCDGEEGAMEIEPLFITANQDEANANMESDDLVLSIPMPVEIRDLLERYVIAHYRPQQKKKRKRKDWLEDSLYAKRSGE